MSAEFVVVLNILVKEDEYLVQIFVNKFINPHPSKLKFYSNLLIKKFSELLLN